MNINIFPVLALAILLCGPGVAGATDAGQPAPNVALPDAQGTVVALEAMRGKVVYVDFWASWCSPCLQSFPWMNELQQRHSKDGFVVLAVNMDQDRALADAFLKKTVVGFRIEYDPQGTIAQKFEVQAMPTSFLIDRSGKASVDALTNGQVQVANIFSTTPWIAVNGFVTLDDPKLLFGSDNVVPLTRKDKVTDTITNTLNAVSAKLTTPILTDLLKQTDIDKKDAKVVAKDFLTSNGLA